MADAEFPVAEIPEQKVYGRPDTAIQALQEAAAHVEPEESTEESVARLRPIREVLELSLGGLGKDERRLIDKIVFERRSFRQLEDEWGIPKTTLHRWYSSAIDNLRELAIQHPQIINYLNGEQ